MYVLQIHCSLVGTYVNVCSGRTAEGSTAAALITYTRCHP
jgi:hypothetical protein